MSEQGENALLCEKLLGWQRHCREVEPGWIAEWFWRAGDGTTESDTPTFLTGDGMLMLLEALAAKGVRFHLTRSVQFGIYIFSWDTLPQAWKEVRDRSAAVAVRLGALQYIRSQS